MDEAKHETNLNGVVQGFVQGEQNIVTFVYQNAKEHNKQIDWNIRLIRSKDLRSESLKLGDAAAARFPYIITPIQDIYNEAIQALYNASVETERIKKGILVTGESNVGKTRLAFETLRQVLPSWLVLRWRPDYIIDDAPTAEFLREKQLVIFIDDLQDYVSTSMRMRDLEERSLPFDPHTMALRSLLETLYQHAQRVVVVATCRSEDKLRVQASLDWLIFQLKNIIIPSFNEDIEDIEAAQIITEFQKQGTIYVEDWDGTLGSLVLGLSTKNTQYLKLPVYISRVLQAMKLLTLAKTNIHTERRIRMICAQIFAEKQFLENERIWQETINQLTQMQFVKEEIDEDSQDMILVIRKDSYFEKVITDYPHPHRFHQLERDFAKLRKIFIELEDTQGLSNLGLAQLLTNKKYEEALTTFDCALALDPNNADLWFHKSFPYVIEGGIDRPKEALKAIEHALSLNPQLHSAWVFKGTMLAELERYDEALDAMKHALAHRAEDVFAWLQQGKILESLKRYEEALTAFDQVLTLDSTYADAWFYKGNVLESLKRYEEALIAFEHSLTLNPDNAEVWYNKGEMFESLKRYEEALTAFDQVLTLDSTHANAWFYKGKILESLKRYEEALTAFNQVLTLDSTHADAWFYKGNVLESLKRYEEALIAFEHSLTLNPDNAEVWYNKGEMFESLKRYEEALTAFDQVLALDSTHANAWSFKGIILMALHQLEEALAAFDQALTLDANSFGAWYHKGITLGVLEQPAEALIALEHALTLDSNFVSAWAFKARMLFTLERTEEALVAFEQSLALDPTRVDDRFLQGISLLLLERTEEALVAFEQSLALDPANVNAWYYKGKALILSKRYDESLAALDQALALEPKNTGVQQSKKIVLKALKNK